MEVGSITRRIAADDAPTVAPGGEESESERGAQDGEIERVGRTSGSALLPPIIWLAVETGMRRGEITSLSWMHVDLNRCVVHLPSTKNGNARDVPLSSRAVAVLQALKDSYDAKGNPTEDGKGDADRVLEIRGDAVTRAFERAAARARKIYVDECRGAKLKPDGKLLTEPRFHDLRHEATSRLVDLPHARTDQDNGPQRPTHVDALLPDLAKKLS